MHIPVLQKEVLQYLDPKPNENFIDATAGQGGHTFAILEKNGPKGKVLGIEWDEEIIENLEDKIKNFKEIKNRLILVCDNYVNLEKIVERERFKKVSGILFDLGISSWHLEESKRGFSFLKNEILDMRYNLQNPLTAEKILNYWSKPEIEKILKDFSEEQFAEKIASQIINERKIRPIKTTFQLVKIIKQAVPAWYQYKKIHSATKTFQALRIAVNDELENIKKVLPQTLRILGSGGKLVIISFHSLEDRIVKIFLRENFKTPLEKNSLTGQSGNLKILTKKPIRPSFEEIKFNPRSRSAKLRAAQLI